MEVPGPREECSHFTVRDAIEDDSREMEVGGFAIVTNVRLVSSEIVLKNIKIL